MAITYKGFMEK